MDPDQEHYEKIATTIARRFAPRSQVLDAMSRDRDDYCQELLLESLQCVQAFQNRHGFSTPAERRYVARALWNRGRRMRAQGYASGRYRGDPPAVDPAVDEVARLDARVELREMYAALHRWHERALVRDVFSGERMDTRSLTRLRHAVQKKRRIQCQ
jgi:hypothetical protein